MKIKGIAFILINCLLSTTVCQNSSLDLTFTAIDSSSWIQVDSIKIMNHSQACDTVLLWPDTLLVIDLQTSIPDDISYRESFQVFQNYPNPVINNTTIELYVPEKDEVNLIISDIFGRPLIMEKMILGTVNHQFQFTPGIG